MAAINDCVESSDLTDGCNAKNNHESNDAPLLPSGELVNNSLGLKSSGNENADIEPGERRKKRRRGKPKRKNPYNKEGNETRKAVSRSKNSPRFLHRHADAPYNTNEFLMEDHNSFVKLNSPPTISDSAHSRPPRIRDPSFTSVDSDEDHFYSSPEDEEEFLTKEFSNTYQALHVETLQGLNKTELIQQILQLEEKIDGLEKKVGNRQKTDKDQFRNSTETLSEDCDISDKMKQFQVEIGRLRLENEQLQIENERLRRRNRSSSVSSVDSESDSTSSSPSSVSELSDKVDLIDSDVNEEMDNSREKCVVVSDDLNSSDVAMQEKEV